MRPSTRALASFSFSPTDVRPAMAMVCGGGGGGVGGGGVGSAGMRFVTPTTTNPGDAVVVASPMPVGPDSRIGRAYFSYRLSMSSMSPSSTPMTMGRTLSERFKTAPGGPAPGLSDHRPPDERTLQLGKSE